MICLDTQILQEEPCPFWFNPVLEETRPQSSYRNDTSHICIFDLGPHSQKRECGITCCTSEKNAATAICNCSPNNAYMCQRCYLWHIATPEWKITELMLHTERIENEIKNFNACSSDLGYT